MKDNKDALEKSAKGYGVRLRFGAGGRRRFYINPELTHGQALRRQAVLREMAGELASAELGQRATPLLKKAAETTDPDELKNIRFLVTELVQKHKKESRLEPRDKTTVRQLAQDWTSGRLHRQSPDHVKVKRSAEDDLGRFRRHIFDHVGDVLVRDFTLEDAELVMRKLPPSLTVASRRQCAQLLSRLFQLAVYPCRLRSSSPIPRGWLPKVGPKKASPILYAEEDAKLLNFREVPIGYRLTYGFAHRMGFRRTEQVELTFGDFDFERGTVRLDRTKTDHARLVSLPRDVCQAVRAWWELRGRPSAETLVFTHFDGSLLYVEHFAAMLRQHLDKAGVKRPELHKEAGANWMKFTYHGLRHSHVTRSLALGQTEDEVRRRTGHKSDELRRYRESALTLADIDMDPLELLDQAIPELKELLEQQESEPSSGADSEPNDDSHPQTTESAVDASIVSRVGQKVGQNDDGPTQRADPRLLNQDVFSVVRKEGLEPPRVASPEPKSGASANSATCA